MTADLLPPLEDPAVTRRGAAQPQAGSDDLARMLAVWRRDIESDPFPVFTVVWAKEVITLLAAREPASR